MARGPARTGRSQTVVAPMLGFERGILGGITDIGKAVRHCRRADNVVFEPLGAVGVRRGYRNIVPSSLPLAGHSLMKYYNLAGNKTFVAAGTKIYQIVENEEYVEQALPVTPTTNRWSHTNLNGALICTQEGGSNPPIAYNGTEWLSLVLPTPGAAAAAVAAGGAVDIGLHKYRVRWRFKNGSSLASATVDATTAGANLTVNLSAVPQSSRSDYIGWTVERTKLGDTTVFYFVNDVNAGVTTYSDTVSDGSLGTRIGAEPGVHGAAPHLEGVLGFGEYLLGWNGTSLYFSRKVADASEASGIFNFHPQENFPVNPDDGDAIVLMVKQSTRVAILKAQSIHALDGFDPATFRVGPVYDQAGCASTRGAASFGGTVFFYGGDQKLYRMDGNRVVRFGQPEVGHYLAEMDTDFDDDVVLVNYQSDYLVMGYTAPPDLFNRHALLYRPLYRTWTHWTDVRIADALVPKRRTDFSKASILIADPSPGETGETSEGVAMSYSRFTGSEGSVNAQRVATTDGTKLFSGDGPALDAGGSFASNPRMVSDGVGGTITAWIDDRGGVSSIYAQRVDADGVEQWTADGVLAATIAVVGITNLVACEDGFGGIILAWDDPRSGVDYDVWAQRVSRLGVPKWTTNGVVVCNAAGAQRFSAIASDGAGGCIIAWRDERGATAEVFTQRVNSAGAVQWAANGVQITNVAGVQGSNIGICPDGTGGAIIAWSDTRAGNTDVYAQRVNSSGAVQWAADGIAIASGAGNQSNPRLLWDGATGAFIAWHDDATTRAMLARLDAAGSFVFAAVNLGDMPAGTPVVSMCTDGDDGVIAAWAGSSFPIYQRLNDVGAPQWGGGFSPPTSFGVYRNVKVTSDGVGGAIVAFALDPTLPGTLSYDIYLHRLRPDGTAIWLTLLVEGAHTVSAPSIEIAFLPDTQSFNVWSAFDGTSDERGVLDQGGVPISFLIETPDWDDGLPDVLKQFDRLQLNARLGRGSLSANLTLDAGAIGSAVPLEAQFSAKRWGGTGVPVTDDTLIWNQGTWAGSRVGEIVAALPSGMFGKKARFTLSAELVDDLVLEGYIIDYRLLPDRGY